MKTKIKNFLPILFFLILTPYAQSQMPVRLPALTSPMIPQNAVGKHISKLEEMRRLYSTNQTYELYELMAKLLKEIRNEERESSAKSSENIAIRHWIAYYQLSSPLFSFEDLEKIRKKYSKQFYIEDFMSKKFAFDFLCRDNVVETAKLFSLDEKTYRLKKIENLSRVFTFFNKIYFYSYDKKKQKEEDVLFRQNARKEIRKYQIIREPNISVSNSYTPSVSHEFERLEIFRKERRAQIRNLIKSHRIGLLNYYIRQLVQCFPNQGRIVQSYVRKTGFLHDWSAIDTTPWIKDFRRKNSQYESEDVQLTLALQRALRDENKYAWVFQGIPSAEKARKLAYEKMHKFNAESVRQTKVSKLLKEIDLAKRKKVEDGRNREFYEANLKKFLPLLEYMEKYKVKINREKFSQGELVFEPIEQKLIKDFSIPPFPLQYVPKELLPPADSAEISTPTAKSGTR